jgi:malate synthase A
MKTEYDAIHAAGLTIQLDAPDLGMGRHWNYAAIDLESFRKSAAMRVEALNHAVRDIPREDGLRQNVNAGIGYVEAWLRGTGCVPLYNLMEDAATAEICRTQLWQWIRHDTSLDDGRAIDQALFETVIDEKLARIRDMVGNDAWNAGRFDDAAALFKQMVEADDFPDFLTLPAYEQMTTAA